MNSKDYLLEWCRPSMLQEGELVLSGPEMATEFEEDVLRALRRITRAIDLHSRHLAMTFGLTGPQLVCLRVVADKGPLSPSQLAREVSLSQATVTGIVDRLAMRQLVERERTSTDRRVVTVKITEAGISLIGAAPSPLQERFAARLETLPMEEQANIHRTLNKIVAMMDGSEIDAAPVLTSEGDLAAAAVVADDPPPKLLDSRQVDPTTSAPTDSKGTRQK